MQAYEQMDEEYRKQLNYEEIRNNIDNLRSEFDRWLEGKDSSTTEIDYEEIRKKLDEMTRERKEEKRRIHEYQVAELKAANERMREEMSRHFTRYVTGDGKLIVH